MEKTIIINDVLIYTEDTFSTDLWPVVMEYYVWINNSIPELRSGLSDIEI